jgi:hypothetical protein
VSGAFELSFADEPISDLVDTPIVAPVDIPASFDEAV